MKICKFIVFMLMCLCLTACNETTSNEETEQATPETKKEYTEEEYKSVCQELYYDDVFFGKKDLEGEYVKLHLMLSEKYYFTSKDASSSTFQKYNTKYNLNTDFYKCCVLREGDNSYVGKQINMWFSNNLSLNPNKYHTGEKVIVYAEVINWSDNTWDGFNSVTIIPKYIETE